MECQQRYFSAAGVIFLGAFFPFIERVVGAFVPVQHGLSVGKMAAHLRHVDLSLVADCELGDFRLSLFLSTLFENSPVLQFFRVKTALSPGDLFGMA